MQEVKGGGGFGGAGEVGEEQLMSLLHIARHAHQTIVAIEVELGMAGRGTSDCSQG